MSNYLLIKEKSVEEKYSPWIALYSDLVISGVAVLEPNDVETIPLWYERYSWILNKNDLKRGLYKMGSCVVRVR